MGKEIIRKGIGRIVVPAVFVGAAAFGVCGPESNPTPQENNRQTVSGTVFPESSHSQWANLTSLERLKALEDKNHPKFSESELLKETDKAIVEFFCQEFRCSKSLEETLASVKHVDEDFFIALDEKDLGRPLTEYERKNTSIAALDDNKNIFINEDILAKRAAEMMNDEKYKELAEGKNIIALTLKEILFHQLVRANIPDYKIDLGFRQFYSEFSPFPSATFTEMVGFKPIGFIDETKEPISVDGVKTAFVEEAANTLIDMTGTNLKLFYQTGQVVAIMNKNAGITKNEALKYISGELSPNEYFERLGELRHDKDSSPTNAVVEALIPIGRSAEGSWPFLDALVRANNSVDLSTSDNLPN